MTVKVTKGQIAVALYQKINVTRSTISWENFILVSKSAHKAPRLALCCSITVPLMLIDHLHIT